MNSSDLIIKLWTPEHLRWAELIHHVDKEGQQDWVDAHYDFHLSSHMLVALRDDNIVGFLRFVVQYIGPPDNCPPMMLDGEALKEAKILAFGVPSAFRRQGIGRRLQLATLDHARNLGCYQVKSFSDSTHPENYALKLSMGFSIQPELRSNGTQGVYFIATLSHFRMDESSS